VSELESDLKRIGATKAPSGFAERVLSEVGLADRYARFDTVLGGVYVAWNGFGVSAAARSATAAEFEEWFRADVGRPIAPGTPPPDLAAMIGDELSGRRRMRFDLRGLTDFEQAVLRKTREIPRGQVRPYSWIAR
jgi:O6-methylguanine-DNA--protein-cysteine methyltransferase